MTVEPFLSIKEEENEQEWLTSYTVIHSGALCIYGCVFQVPFNAINGPFFTEKKSCLTVDMKEVLIGLTLTNIKA